MSEEHEHEGACLHICRGVGVRYRARARWLGYQKYELLGGWTRSKRKAIRELADAIATGQYKRGDVLMIADYYDPVQICEMVRP